MITKPTGLISVFVVALAIAAVGMVLTIGAAPLEIAKVAAPGTCEEGVALYEEYRYADAFSALAIAAGIGDVRAQQ